MSKKYGEIVIVAPEIEQSGKSHAINVYSGIEVKNMTIYFQEQLRIVLIQPPQLIVLDLLIIIWNMILMLFFSGINNGYNMGEDIMYSGTVAGASEAVFLL